ncbi:hypothetical protein KJ980_02035 [Patescibacteria group bacterium]|nr:hypothetical protein [Patescibacteria group bacterium]MBU4016903.1 hypothetical protein [Patescibacteria group bacterium]MBU4098409.1 hypothetical protein [Patescibacteria group bacterium]
MNSNSVKSIFFNEIIKKKLIGTALALTTFVIVFLTGYSIVNAQFISSSNTLIVTGVVTAKSATNFTIFTDSTEPITFAINKKTVITGSGHTFSVGDSVRVISKNNIAQVVNVGAPVSGYGYPGDNVVINKGKVTAKTSSSITVNTGTAIVTVQILPSTRFIKTTLSSLSIGNTVIITGKDNGASYVANTVIKK